MPCVICYHRKVIPYSLLQQTWHINNYLLAGKSASSCCTFSYKNTERQPWRNMTSHIFLQWYLWLWINLIIFYMYRKIIFDTYYKHTCGTAHCSNSSWSNRLSLWFRTAVPNLWSKDCEWFSEHYQVIHDRIFDLVFF